VCACACVRVCAANVENSISPLSTLNHKLSGGHHLRHRRCSNQKVCNGEKSTRHQHTSKGSRGRGLVVRPHNKHIYVLIEVIAMPTVTRKTNYCVPNPSSDLYVHIIYRVKQESLARTCRLSMLCLDTSIRSQAVFNTSETGVAACAASICRNKIPQSVGGREGVVVVRPLERLYILHKSASNSLVTHVSSTRNTFAHICSPLTFFFASTVYPAKLLTLS